MHKKEIKIKKPEHHKAAGQIKRQGVKRHLVAKKKKSPNQEKTEKDIGGEPCMVTRHKAGSNRKGKDSIKTPITIKPGEKLPGK